MHFLRSFVGATFRCTNYSCVMDEVGVKSEQEEQHPPPTPFPLHESDRQGPRVEGVEGGAQMLAVKNWNTSLIRPE